MIDTTRIKDIREDNDITQEQMASIMGVKRSTYSMWEIGLSIMSMEELWQFAKYFNYSLEYVLGINNNRKVGTIKQFSYEIIGKNIKKLRIKNNYSQIDLARKMQVTQACIVRWEKSKVKISIPNMYKLATIFKVSISELLTKN